MLSISIEFVYIEKFLYYAGSAQNNVLLKHITHITITQDGGESGITGWRTLSQETVCK